MLDPYVTYLQERWEAGCSNSAQLWCDIQAQGYRGGRIQVARWMRQKPTAPASTTPKKYHTSSQTHQHVLRDGARSGERLPTPRQLAWLITQASTTYTEQECALLETLRGESGFAEAYSLGQRFVQMIRKHKVDDYDAWMTDCANSGLRTLQTFADTRKQDSAAVLAALTEEWSSGRVEGQITRVKMGKWQMYGRASFHLLRQRILGPP